MEVYKLEERNRQRFLKMPKDLILNKCYRNILTSDAKIVYGLLLDRMELSRKNEWVNENNEIYLLFTKDKIADALGISNRTVYKAFNLLEKLELIKQERQGRNRPNRIYIGKTNADYSGNCKICRSEPAECAEQDVQNMQGSDTELNETDKSETDKTYILPKKSTEGMRVFLNMYKNHTGEKHQPTDKYIVDKANAIMKRVILESGIQVLKSGLVAYFDNVNADKPRLDYFVKVAPRYFDTQFYDIL